MEQEKTWETVAGKSDLWDRINADLTKKLSYQGQGKVSETFKKSEGLETLDYVLRKPK